MLPFYCPICFLTYLLGISPCLNHASLIWLGGYYVANICFQKHFQCNKHPGVEE